MKFTRSIETSDLKLFGSLEEAQRHELELLLGNKTNNPADIAAVILDNSDKVLDILTTTERSRPSARKINGATRKKRQTKALTSPPGSE